MATEKAMTSAPDYRTIVQKTNDALIPMVREQMAVNGIPADEYQVQCMSNAVMVINDLANNAGISISAVDRTSLVECLQQTATLRLNAFSQPRECYYITRKKKQADGSWGIVVEMGIEGDGNEAILRNFGHNVETVYPFWEIREDDEFAYPKYRGLEMEPPAWTPSGSGKVVRVVYPIKFKDGSVRYFIGEREDVRVNLMAHINNNLMNETFGIAETRYKANVTQKKEIDAKKKELLTLAKGKKLDEIFEIPELQQYISPAWGEDGRERMILRKMRNNVIKPIPKDFSNAMTLNMYNRASSDIDEQPQRRTVTTVDLSESDYNEIREPQQLAPPAATEPQPVPQTQVPDTVPAAQPDKQPRPQAAPF